MSQDDLDGRALQNVDQGHTGDNPAETRDAADELSTGLHPMMLMSERQKENTAVARDQPGVAQVLQQRDDTVLAEYAEIVG